MRTLVISNASSYAVMGLLSADASIINQIEWTSTESKDVSSQYAANIQKLLVQSKTLISALKTIVVVSGPGTFTGLRNSMSFAIGLSQSLGIPLQTMSLFDIYQRNCFIPTRHQAAKTLSLAEALANNLEFIQISASDKSDIRSPTNDDLVLGLSDRPSWPSLEEMSLAIFDRRTHSSDKIELIYGLNPKISGQRI